MLTPVLGRMADNLEAVVKADEETRQKIAESLEKHFVGINVAYNSAMENFNEFSDGLKAEVQGIAQRRRWRHARFARTRRRGEVRSPRLCNTGSGTRRETGSGVKMKCDWYAATLPDTPENVVSYMENNIGGTLKKLKSGLHGYSDRWVLDNEHGNANVTILAGGNNGANPHAFAVATMLFIFVIWFVMCGQIMQ